MLNLMRYLLGLISVLIVWLGLTGSAIAAGEFGTNYDVSYQVGVDGMTTVNEQITVKNLTDKYFASDFSLAISADQINNLEAYDAKGPLEVSQSRQGDKAVILVKFGQQIVGQDKQYQFNLKFSSPNFARHLGQIWQINIPKAPQLADHDQFLLRLSVPVSFGDPTAIKPTPLADREAGGLISYLFDQAQLKQSGIQATFGSQQWLNFKLQYQLVNNGVLPEIRSVPVPADRVNQQVLLQTITPAPENVTIDQDGNYLAWFKVGARQQQSVQIAGQAELTTETKASSERNSTLVQPAKYWEVTNPLVKQQLDQVLASDSAKPNSSSVSQKAELIDRFVANYLRFDPGHQMANRLGAVTALNNPDSASNNEYVDVFVTLARAANIPARRVEGYANSASSTLQPLPNGSPIHVWAEYHDPDRGWLMVDPAWENTSGGVDYFSQPSLDRFGLLTLGDQSNLNYPTPQISVDWVSQPIQPQPVAKLVIESPDQITAGWPLVVKITAENTGNVTIGSAPLNISSHDGLILGQKTTVMVPTLPPFGKFEYNLRLRGGNFWQSQSDQLMVDWQATNVAKMIQSAPFFANPLQLAGWLAMGLVTVGLYGLVFGLHLRSRRSFK